jgi:hypothetical protein
MNVQEFPAEFPAERRQVTPQEISSNIPLVEISTDLFLQISSVFLNPDTFLEMPLGAMYRMRDECNKITNRLVEQALPLIDKDKQDIKEPFE